MSRTYRKRPYTWRYNEALTDWFCHEDNVVWEDVEQVRQNRFGGYFSRQYYDVTYKANSKTGKRMLARGRRDTRISFKEPGPAFWRRMTSEASMKTHNKRELRKFIDEAWKLSTGEWEFDYEPLVYAKFPLDYWT